MNMQEKIEKALDKIRPMIEADGGGIEFVDWDEETKTVRIRLVGACIGCPMSQVTLKNSVEAGIKKEIPEIKEIKNI